MFEHGSGPVFDHFTQKYLCLDVPIVSHPVDPVVANATFKKFFAHLAARVFKGESPLWVQPV